MSQATHVFDFLAAPADQKLKPVIVAFGDEPFLKKLALDELRRQVLGAASDTPFTSYDCQEKVPDWRDVVDELATASLFGGSGPRFVLLERADAFVTAYRQKLEDYVAKPSRTGILVLDVDEWLATTRLYKAVDQEGLSIECRPPQRQVGKNKVVDEHAVVGWLLKRAHSHHQLTLAREAAQLLVDLSGPVFGVLDQDLAKLALFVAPNQKATPELVQEVIGGWRAQTTWDLIDAAVGGDAAAALTQLERLLQSGEHPLALFGSISWSLRRYAAATRIFQQSERRGQKIGLKEALTQAGFRDWPLGTLKAAETRLIQLGRIRGSKLYPWLLETDLALKGTHSHETRARFVLEHLFLRLAKGAAPAVTRS